MELFLFILGILIVTFTIMWIVAMRSKTPDPEDDEEFHENAITMDNRYPWKGGKKASSN